MTEHVLTTLTQRRAKLAGEADALRTRLAALTEDIGHIDAVIRQFDPEYDLGAIRPKRPRGPDVARPGERSRGLLDMLRQAGEPLRTAEVVQRVMAQHGQDAGDQRLVRMLTKRIGTTLVRQEKRGAVRSAREEGRAVVWEIMR